jgi:hypothetical protein
MATRRGGAELFDGRPGPLLGTFRRTSRQSDRHGSEESLEGGQGTPDLPTIRFGLGNLGEDLPASVGSVLLVLL